MANQRRSGGGGKGIKGFLTSAGTLVILIAATMGWANVNNINSVSSAYDYFKAWSDKATECGAEKAEWNCESPLGGSNNNNGGTTKPSDKPSSGESSKPSSNTDNGSGDNEKAPEVISGPNMDRATALSTLDTLRIAKSEEVDYDRSEWKHWTGSPCDTRETILKEQGQNVKSDPKTCKAISGTWIDPYSKEVFDNASNMDIDHIIPLSWSAQNGGNAWSPEKKEQFANDKTQLLVSSAKENRGKSDKGPSEYMPPNRDFHCTYSKIWVATAKKYDLSIPDADKVALKAGLLKC